jgi:hypothetical protein
MANLWHWIAFHWQGWGINGMVAAIASALTWVLARRKEWKDSRKSKAQQRIDTAVWERIRPVSNYAISQDSQMIAEALSLDQDAVGDSLARLEAQGKVRRHEGTLDHPAPYWTAILR